MSKMKSNRKCLGVPDYTSTKNPKPMKLLIALLVMIPNICLAAPLDGAWYESVNDIGFLIAQKNNKLQVVMKTNSGCKPIYTKMNGVVAQKDGNTEITLLAKDLKMPDGCSLELVIMVEGTLTDKTLIVSEGMIISAVRCGDKEKVDTDSLDKTFFNRISPQEFIKGVPNRNKI